MEEMNYWMIHVKRLNGTKNWGISDDPNVVRWNRSTGGCALNVAYLMGAREIVLMGYDMTMDNGHHNWHDSYLPHYSAGAQVPIPKPGPGHYDAHFVMPFDRLAEELDKRGVAVKNANPNSRLKSFPFCDRP